MTKRGRCQSELSDERLAAIEQVRASLDERCAADWFELMWWSEWPNVMLVWLLAFAGTATVAFEWAPLEAMVPLCVWMLAAQVIPTTLLDRFPHRPVWARAVVVLRDDEKAALAELLELPGGLGRLLCGAPPRNGKELWMLRERALLRQNLHVMMRRQGIRS